jgi:hypothetical protein
MPMAKKERYVAMMGGRALAELADSLLKNETRVRYICDSMDADEKAPLTDFGFTIENASSSTSDRKAKVTQALSDWHAQYVAPFQKDAVFVDTTTLATVEALAAGHYSVYGSTPEVSVTPGILYDLCAFINAVVLFDSVLYLENPFVDPAKLNTGLASGEPPLRQLPVKSFDGAASHHDPIVGVGGGLTSLMWNAEVEVMLWRDARTPAAREARDAVAHGWRCATGAEVRIDQFADDNHIRHQFSSDGPQLLRAALEGEHSAPDEKIKLFLDSSFLTESTVRSVFNTGVSEMIGIGYAASSARLPFRRYWLDIQDVACSQFLVSEQLDIALRDAATRTIDRVSLELPFFPAAVLREIKDPSELLPAIGRLRDAAAGFRNRRADLNAAIDDRNDRVIKELTLAVQDESRSLAQMLTVPAIGAAIAIVTAPVTLAHSLWLPVLALYAGFKDLNESNKERLCRRLSKRHLCFLTKTASQSRELLDAYPQVGRLWPQSPMIGREEFATIFASLGQLGEA